MSNLVFGAYELSIDSKGRILLPADVRALWSLSEGSKLKITVRPDECLVLLLPETWQKEVAEFQQEKPDSTQRRRFIEAFVAYTREEDVDSTGRLMLTKTLRHYAAITTGAKKGLRMKGYYDRFFIMNEEVWNRQEAELKADAADRSWEKA